MKPTRHEGRPSGRHNQVLTPTNRCDIKLPVRILRIGKQQAAPQGITCLVKEVQPSRAPYTLCFRTAPHFVRICVPPLDRPRQRITSLNSKEPPNQICKEIPGPQNRQIRLLHRLRSSMASEFFTNDQTVYRDPSAVARSVHVERSGRRNTSIFAAHIVFVLVQDVGWYSRGTLFFAVSRS